MQLAIAVKDLGATQLNFDIVRKGNDLVREGANLTLLFESISRPPLQPNFACLHIMDGWGYRGPVVATTLSTAAKILRFPSPLRRLFWVYDLEWLRMPTKDFRALQATYAHPDLTLLSRCRDHARIIADAWGREPLVVESGDLSGLFEAARATA